MQSVEDPTGTAVAAIHVACEKAYVVVTRKQFTAAPVLAKRTILRQKLILTDDAPVIPKERHISTLQIKRVLSHQKQYFV